MPGPTRQVFVALAALGCVAAGLAVCGHRQGGEPPPPAPRPRLDPSVRALLDNAARGDPDHTSAFFAALTDLARRHGPDVGRHLLPRFAEDGYAVRLDGPVIVILAGWSHTIPGGDTQHLLLLGESGRLLDRLSCSVNCRLTRLTGEGHFRTEVAAAPQADGARLVVRYLPGEGGRVTGNCAHEIEHGGRTHAFHWDQDRADATRSVEWEGKGLCRVGVRGDRFEVVFPGLK